MKIVFILGVILCFILCGLIILKYGELVWVILINRVIWKGINNNIGYCYNIYLDYNDCKL